MKIKSNEAIAQLSFIRNRYDTSIASEKPRLMDTIGKQRVSRKNALVEYYNTLQFIAAYPDNKAVYNKANNSLEQLKSQLASNERAQTSLYNTGVTGSKVCAAFSVAMTKWLRQKHRDDISLSFFSADDAQIQAILSVVMTKVESEIMQDANAEWKGWLKQQRNENEDLLDQLIAIFDATTIRPEVKDELWNAIGINVEIYLSERCRLPDHLVKPFFHRSLMRKVSADSIGDSKIERVSLNVADAECVIDCSRMVLIRHLREIDPISFTSPELVSYYRLPRGLSIALVGMVPERRHPNDCYMGYTVFKNGLPVAYAASWIFFDSGRISLNVFPGYRGGESQFIFQQVLRVHKEVYGLKRFSVDPYQIGKENTDGIKSGAFWVYYHQGFRPMKKEQRELAEAEAKKVKSMKGYRSPANVLKNLADSRMELVMDQRAVRFDATDLSSAWAAVLKEHYNTDRKLAEENGVEKLVAMLGIKNRDANMNFVLQNWSVLLLSNEKELRRNGALKQELKKLVELKTNGSEEEYIREMRRATELRKFLEDVVLSTTESNDGIEQQHPV